MSTELLQLSLSISRTVDSWTTSTCPECCRQDDFQPRKTRTRNTLPHSVALATSQFQNNLQAVHSDVQHPSREVFSGRRLDVYHTFTHGVALVQI